MNFYSHAVVASWLSPDPGFVLGAMLPDLCRMAGEKPIRGAGVILDGVRCHEHTDEIFHAHGEFRRLCADAFNGLSARGLARGSAKAGAHIGVELLIDGALFDDEFGRSHYLKSIQASPALLSSVQLSAGLSRVLAAMRERGVERAHTSANAIARRIDYATRGRRRLALGQGDIPRIGDWAEAARAGVVAATPTLIRDVAKGIGAVPPANSRLSW